MITMFLQIQNVDTVHLSYFYEESTWWKYRGRHSLFDYLHFS